MLKVSRGISPENINEIVHFREEINYELRQRSQFNISSVHSVFSGTESLIFLGPKIWALIRNEMKQLESLWKLRKEIKQWKPKSCLCRFCKRCIHRIRFL